MAKKERTIKKNKPIFRLVLTAGVYALCNTDNLFIYASSDIVDLARVCAMFSNMPWQFDTADLKYFDKNVENKFWLEYDAECERLNEKYVKLHHNN